MPSLSQILLNTKKSVQRWIFMTALYILPNCKNFLQFKARSLLKIGKYLSENQQQSTNCFI
jgi:hypothetical protein